MVESESDGRPWEGNRAEFEREARNERELGEKEAEGEEEDEDEPRPDSPGEAMQYWVDLHGGSIDNQHLIDVATQLRQQRASTRDVGEIISWEPIGPGNVGGRTRAILIDPVTPATMYAAGVSGGIWKTTDAGASWSPLDDLMGNLAVVSLAFQRQGSPSVDTSIIYAGTGEGFFNGDAVQGAGIFTSTDSGQTWGQLASTANSDFYYVNKIVASPNNALVLYAATRTGIWKTSNGGTSWTLMLANTGAGGPNATVATTYAGFLDLTIRTDLGTDTLLASNGGSAAGDGVYRSLDAGVTWNRVLTATSMRRVSLAIAPSNQNFMYALAAGSNSAVLNVYKSIDGGAAWAPTQLTTFAPNFMGRQGWYNNTIAVAPDNPNIVFAGGIDLVRSNDGGVTWSQISWWPLYPASAHSDQHIIVFDPAWNGTTNQTMIVGNDGGIQKTDNALDVGGQPNPDGNGYGGNIAVQWTLLNNGYQTTQFYHGRPMPVGVDGYLGGAQDNGTHMGTDAQGPNAWVKLLGGDGAYVSYDPADPNTLFFGVQNIKLYRKKAGTIQGILNGAITNNGLFINPHRIDPSNGDIIWYGSYDGVWRSTNASSAPSATSVTWIKAGTVGPPVSYAISPYDSNKVYLTTNAFGGIWKNLNALTATANTAWTQIGIPGNGIYVLSPRIEIDANDVTGETVYLANPMGYNGFIGAPAQLVWRSVNGGATWTNISNNLPVIPAYSIAIQPGHPNNLYLGTALGVFESLNAGATWRQLNERGLANTAVMSLEFQGPNTLYAFTYGRGAFRATLANTSDGLGVSPLGAFQPSGNAGGPFSPASKVFTLQSLGGSVLNWTASADVPWLTVSPANGSLAADASTKVTVSLAGAANALPGGTHNATITFTNTTSGQTQQRPVTMTITGGPAFAPDAFEDDDAETKASFIGVDGFDQLHNFHDLGDTDWVEFYATQGEQLAIQTLNLEGQCDTEIDLYSAADTNTALASNDDVGGGEIRSSIFITIPTTGLYFAKVHFSTDPAATGDGFGAGTGYTLRVSKEEAPCLNGQVDTISVQAVEPSTGEPYGVGGARITLVPVQAEGPPSQYLAPSTNTYTTTANGTYTWFGLNFSKYRFVIDATSLGYPRYVATITKTDTCGTQNTSTVSLPFNSMPEVYVNPNRNQYDNQDGSQAAPFRTLSDAARAAKLDNSGAVMRFYPGAVHETRKFTKKVTLVNANPAGGIVRLGVVP